jgi:hypothetical protein
MLRQILKSLDPEILKFSDPEMHGSASTCQSKSRCLAAASISRADQDFVPSHRNPRAGWPFIVVTSTCSSATLMNGRVRCSIHAGSW